MSLPPLDRLIPHRPPMRLVTEIVGHVGDRFVCRGVIPPELAADGVASPLLGIEMGAQAAAVMAALDRAATEEESEPPAIGYLVSIRAASFAAATLPAGRSLTVSVRSLGGMHPLASYEIAVSRNGSGESLVSATIGTYLTS